MHIILMRRGEVPCCLVFVVMASNLAAPEMKGKVKGSAKGEVEVVGVPRHPVMTVVNVGVSVMPSPVHKLDCHDVIWNVNEDLNQSSCGGRRKKIMPFFSL